MSCYLKVYGRVRPSASGGEDIALSVIDKNQVRVEADGKSQKVYELHRIFSSNVTQEEIFSSAAKRMVEECTEGINGTIFAYGQTGSGKTHTMLGPADSWSDPVAKGLIPRSIEYLFDQLEKKANECQKFTFRVNVEFVELYNEEIFDLLSSQSKIILRDTGNEIQLVGAKSENVDNSLDLMHVVKRGWQSRRTGATAMNRDSSRSHALLIVKIDTESVTGDLRTTRRSTLNLVDLAGSERQSHTKASGERLKEATNINSSLTVLGRCIRLLSKPMTAQTFIPYRDSHLTHILKNSLGGNSKTTVIVNMHPDRAFISESSSTLLFAEACTMIKNKVLRNEVMTGDQENSYKRAIQELRQDVETARAKAREEFTRRLEESEENHRRLSAEVAALRSENTELRTKYNLGLVKYSISSESTEIPERLQDLLASRKLSESSENISAKMLTLALELEATERRCQLLQEDRDEIRERLHNNTIQMQTPQKRRASSRPQRRDTIYQPSPSRLNALRNEDSEADEKMHELEMRVEQLETENQMWKSRYEKAMEEKFKTEELHGEEVARLNLNVEVLSKENAEVLAENADLEAKVIGGSKTLNNLLNLLNKEKTATKDEIAKREEMEIRLAQEMEDMRNHYLSRINSIEENASSIQKFNTSSTQEMKEALEQAYGEVRDLQKDVSMKREEIQQLNTIVEEMTASLNVKENEVSKNGCEIAELRETINAKQVDLVTKDEMISQLEKKTEKFAASTARIAVLEDEVQAKEAELRYVRFKFQEAKENENLLKNSMEDYKKSQEVILQNYQKDIENTRMKAQLEIEDCKKSYDSLKTALDVQKNTYEKQRSASSKKFDDKIAELKKMFAETRISDLKEKEDQVRRELRAEIKQMEAKTENKVFTLQAQIDSLQKLREEDSENFKEQMGVKKGRVSYIDSLRQKVADLTAENTRLLAENTRLSGPERPRRVLRNRNEEK